MCVKYTCLECPLSYINIFKNKFTESEVSIAIYVDAEHPKLDVILSRTKFDRLRNCRGKASASALRWPITAVNLMQTRCHVSNEYATDVDEDDDDEDDHDDDRPRDGVTAAAGHKRGKRKKALKYKSETRERTAEAALIFRSVKFYSRTIYFIVTALFISCKYLNDGSIARSASIPRIYFFSLSLLTEEIKFIFNLDNMKACYEC